MRRRDLIGALAATLLGAPGRAFSQQPGKLPRVGVLVSGPTSGASVARMSEAISGFGPSNHNPHVAEPVIGRRFARTRWLMRATD